MPYEVASLPPSKAIFCPSGDQEKERSALRTSATRVALEPSPFADPERQVARAEAQERELGATDRYRRGRVLAAGGEQKRAHSHHQSLLQSVPGPNGKC